MQTRQTVEVARDPTVFDVNVREVAERLDMSQAQVRAVSETHDAISGEWAHPDG